jgi:hypothetical protein
VTFFSGSEETLGVKKSMGIGGPVETLEVIKSFNLHFQDLSRVLINPSGVK